ncbi:type IV pilin protein [Thiopseudomonas alkaliphila]|uniref:type IV pilin protein n=1 Tax=Thiopseudomonas alkaliphila TaxID=1697053 RepID=UPI002575DD34|nr:type IV pilin protein [Thiopseudomonas alkaliphila]MDM1707374.1 type IV pilin protein [Thiopseudomonas alkaliphila]
MDRQRIRGFTLFELIITVAIVGLLASIVYSSHKLSVHKGYRAEGKAYLMDLAIKQEQYHFQHQQYVIENSKLAELKMPARSVSQKYQVSLAKLANDGGYTLQATPLFDDELCGTLSINAKGEKKPATAGCWPLP